MSSARTAALLMLCLSFVPMAGCRESASKKVEQPAAVSEQPVDENASLLSTVTSLQPEEFDVNVPRDLPVGELNEWADRAFDDNIDQDINEELVRASLLKIIGEEQTERALRRRYALRDAVHIRDMLWARAVVESQSADAAGELERIVDLFQFVVDTLQPAAAPERIPPMSPFELALSGESDPNGRIWTLAILLRQRRIPVVRVDVPLPENAVRRPALAGVLVDRNLYLFDMASGLPVPGAGGDPQAPFVRRPATLGEVLADDSLLRQMDEPDRPWPLTSESFQQCRLEVIGDTSLWSRRMEALQNGLSGTVSAILFEPLVSQGTLEGSLEYVREMTACQVAAEKVGIWGWPEQQREAAQDLSAEQQAVMDEITDSWRVPQTMTIRDRRDADGKPLAPELQFAPGSGTHRQARTDQLMGRTQEAIPTYLRIQTWRRLPPTARGTEIVPPEVENALAALLPEDIRRRHSRASEQAQFWRACSQMQKGSYDTAAVDFEQYLRHLPEGLFAVRARYYTAVCLARQGNFRRAVSFLKTIPAESGHYEAARFLIRRWSSRIEQN